VVADDAAAVAVAAAVVAVGSAVVVVEVRGFRAVLRNSRK
jgi:hypothetical protein